MILPITSKISVPQHAGNNPRRFLKKQPPGENRMDSGKTGMDLIGTGSF